MSWRRTLLTLLVVDLFVWRSWLASAAGDGGRTGPDYQGLCALAAAAATIVLGGVVWARSRQLYGSGPDGAPAPTAGTMLLCTAAVIVLGAAALAAVALGH